MTSRHFFALAFLILLSGSAIASDFGEGTLTVDFNLVPGPPLFLGEKIEKIEIEIFYPNGEKVPLERLNSPTLRIGDERQSFELEKEGGKLVAKLDYTIGLTENLLMEGNNRLQFGLIDLRETKNGYWTENVEKWFEVSDSYAVGGNEFKVRVRSPPSNERILHDREMLFQIEVTKKGDVQGEKVFLTDDQDLEKLRECWKVKEDGERLVFQCAEQIPSKDEVFRMHYAALAIATVAGRELTVYTTSQNELSNNIRFESVFPGNGDFMHLDEVENRIELEFYSDSQRLEGGSFSGTINDLPVEFVWNQEEETYSTEFDLESLGVGRHELEFSFPGFRLQQDVLEVEFVPTGQFPGGGKDGFGPDGFVSDGFSPDSFGPESDALNPVILLLAVAVPLAVFTFIVWFLVLRKKKEETIAELKEESVRLKELLKRIEIDYFKRRLSEEEYKSRLLEYQTRLDEALAKIKAKGAMPKRKRNKI